MSTISRRTFVKHLGLGVAAGSFLARPGHAAAGPQMRLAIDSTMFTRQKAPVWPLIRQAGYRFVELGIAHFRSSRIERDGIERLRTELATDGLTPVSAFIVHPMSSPDEERRAQAVADWQRSIQASAGLGLKLITTELTGDLTQPARSEAAFRKSMEVILPALERAGIHLSVEPHPGDFFEAALPTIKLLRSYGSKHLGYLHCLPHTFFLGKSREVIQAAGPLLTHVHVADTFRRERLIARAGIGLHMHLRPPLGEVDFREAFDALREIGYQGSASVQLLSHLDDPVGSARLTRTWLLETFPGCFKLDPT